jgi:hypothetical protein
MVGKDPDDALPPSQLLVQALLDVGGTEPFAIDQGQCQHSGGVVEAPLQRSNDRWSALLIVRNHLSQEDPSGLEVGCLEEGSDSGMEFLLEGFGSGVTDIGGQVHLASLKGAPPETALEPPGPVHHGGRR